MYNGIPHGLHLIWTALREVRRLGELWQRASERCAGVGAASPADLAAAEGEHDELLRLARALQSAECAAGTLKLRIASDSCSGHLSQRTPSS